MRRRVDTDPGRSSARIKKFTERRTASTSSAVKGSRKRSILQAILRTERWRCAFLDERSNDAKTL
ncbi:hypothetical protein CRUP_024554, partial [Coryphaenoides rupestris]